jgi:rhamnopyranosyl-N-acetylglucosaminyl-diphospho-decaprenol beta-1,3/1,4-galactofuranosyltransferase
MRVLAHIHTFNEAAFIDQALEGLQRQIRRPDAIIIVDNGSTDGTVDRTFPENVTVVVNSADLGTSGSVGVGFTHALKHGFDWIWVLDADSVPKPDALANLLASFEGMALAEREEVCFLACRLATESNAAAHRPLAFTESGLKFVSPSPELGYCRCDLFIWSGSLFRMAAVAKIGLPSPDYFMDLSELDYGYRAMRLGFTSYVVESAVLHQDVGRTPGVATRFWRLGPLSIRLYEISPARCYYYVRNMLYFWLYQFRPARPLRIARTIVHAIVFPRTFAVRPYSHSRHLIACLRGLRDGLTGNMGERY